MADFSLKNRLACLDTKFPYKNKKDRKLWTYTNPNNSKVQVDYIFINKQWINNTVIPELSYQRSA